MIFVLLVGSAAWGQWQTNGSNIFYNNGSVGIGINLPLADLHINGADNNGVTAALRISSGSQHLLLDGNEIDVLDGQLNLNGNVSNNVVLAGGGGNVAIGVNVPAAKLHVAGGEIRFPGGTGANPGLMTHFNWFSDGNNYIRGNTIIADGNGVVGIGVANPGAKLHVAGGEIRFPGGTGATPGHMTHFNWVTDGNNYIRGNTIVADGGGKMGVGTQMPDAKLHVNGADNDGATAAFKVSSGNGSQNLLFDGNEIDAVNNQLWLNANSDNNVILTGASGGVGIGVNTPTARLDVAGDLKLQSGTNANEISTDGTLADNSDDAVPTEQAVKTYVDAAISSAGMTGDPNYVAKFDGTGLENSSIYDNGNVGIGTLTPDANLHVNGADNNGTTAALKISSLNGAQSILIDGNEIDAVNNQLWLNSNSLQNVILTGASGSVGIGVNTPTARLDIAGDLKLQSGTSANEISTDGTLADNSDDAVPTEQAVKTYVDAAITNAGMTGDPNYISKFDGNGLVNSSIYDNGNVGIGTTNPLSELHVATGEIRFPGGTGAVPGYMTHFNWFADGNNYIRGNTIVADGNGKVGIGTHLPDTKLHVSGADNDGTTAALKISSVNGTQNILIDGNEIDAVNNQLWLNANSDNNVILTGASGSVGVGVNIPTARLDIAGDIKLQNGTNVNEISTDGTLADNSDDAVPTEQAVKTYVDGEISALGMSGDANYVPKFNGTGLENSSIYDNGNVGIGTTSPAAKFHVEGGEVRFPGGTGAVPGYMTHFNWYADGNNYIRGNTTIADGNGKVGIGTHLPDTKLHVSGDDNDGTTAAFKISSGNGSQNMLLDGNEIDVLAGQMNLNSNTANNVIMVNGGGNVGVGTTAPVAKFHVEGGEVRFPAGTGATPGYSTHFKWAGDGNNYIRGNTTIADGNGKVGIGTHTPDAKLHVNGDDNNGMTAALKISSVNGTQNILIDGNEIDAVNNQLWLNANSDNNVILTDDNGKVGIGTGSPIDKLDVEGNVRVNNNLILLRDDVDETDGLGYNAFAAYNSALSVDGPVLFGAGGGALGYGKGGSYRTLLNWFNNDRVGIRTMNPQTNLHVAGNVLVNGTITAFSDRRFKKDIRTLDNALENILKLRGVNYDMRTDEFADYYFSDRKQIGFIAQEVEEVIPEVVVTYEDGYKSLDYTKITPILVEAIKEQQDIIDGQQSELDVLKDRMDQIEQMLQKLNGNEEEGAPVEEDGVILNQNVPNPFSDMTTITYELENAGNVRLDIYDVMGRHIDSLISEYQEAGSYSVEWEADGIPSGLYIYSLMVDGKELSKRAIISRS